MDSRRRRQCFEGLWGIRTDDPELGGGPQLAYQGEDLLGEVARRVGVGGILHHARKNQFSRAGTAPRGRPRGEKLAVDTIGNDERFCSRAGLSYAFLVLRRDDDRDVGKLRGLLFPAGDALGLQARRQPREKPLFVLGLLPGEETRAIAKIRRQRHGARRRHILQHGRSVDINQLDPVALDHFADGPPAFFEKLGPEQAMRVVRLKRQAMELAVQPCRMQQTEFPGGRQRDHFLKYALVVRVVGKVRRALVAAAEHGQYQAVASCQLPAEIE